jgi:hypothetical protein
LIESLWIGRGDEERGCKKGYRLTFYNSKNGEDVDFECMFTIESWT